MPILMRIHFLNSITYDQLFFSGLFLGKVMVAYTKPQHDLRFERWPVVRFMRAIRKQDVL